MRARITMASYYRCRPKIKRAKKYEKTLNIPDNPPFRIRCLCSRGRPHFRDSDELSQKFERWAGHYLGYSRWIDLHRDDPKRRQYISGALAGYLYRKRFDNL